jgi:hypothetical protein
VKFVTRFCAHPAHAFAAHQAADGEHRAVGAGAWILDLETEGGGDSGNEDDAQREEREQRHRMREQVPQPLDGGEETCDRT